MRESQSEKFCKCIKKVRRTIKPRRGSNKESAAIAICTKSVLQTRGRTLRRFTCKNGKPNVQTQKSPAGGRRR